MATAPTPYRLKLKKLEFLSAVDRGAQGPIANAVLLKRAGKRDAVEATFNVAKTDAALGLVFGWAFASSLDGGTTPHVDYQDDAIDPDFLKACVDFVEGGAATDVMHDGKQDGRVVFAFPLLPDVCKALGIETSTVGLAVAIKPSAETFKRFQSGELGAFSIGGTGEREPLTKRRGIRKMAILTSLTDGHQHSIDLDDPADGWSDMLSTSAQTAEGATTSHLHAWVFDMTSGKVTIAADSGHTHTVADAVPAAVLAAHTAIMADDSKDIAAIPAAIAAETSDGIPALVADEPSSGATVNVTIVQARAPRADDESTRAASATRKSPHAAPLPHGGSHTENIMANENKTVAVPLTEAQYAHYSKLSATDGEVFLAKSAPERTSIVKAALDADPIEYTTTSGMPIRKSAGDLAIALAKQSDEQAKTIAIQTTDLAKANDARMVEIYKARAKTEIGNIAGDDDAKIDLLKAIDAFASEQPRRDAMIGLVKSADAFAKDAGKARGHDGSAGVHGPEAELTAAVTKYQELHKLPSYEVALVKATASDAAIRKLYDATA